MTASADFVFDAHTPWESGGPGIKRKVLGHDAGLMTVRVVFDTGGVGTPHTHPHVQTCYVVSGVFDITISGITQRLRSGDSFKVPSGALHGAVCIEAGELIDSFTPARLDFLPASPGA